MRTAELRLAMIRLTRALQRIEWSICKYRNICKDSIERSICKHILNQRIANPTRFKVFNGSIVKAVLVFTPITSATIATNSIIAKALTILYLLNGISIFLLLLLHTTRSH